jgi:hypothetical protein
MLLSFLLVQIGCWIPHRIDSLAGENEEDQREEREEILISSGYLNIVFVIPYVLPWFIAGRKCICVVFHQFAPSAFDLFLGILSTKSE